VIVVFVVIPQNQDAGLKPFPSKPPLAHEQEKVQEDDEHWQILGQPHSGQRAAQQQHENDIAFLTPGHWLGGKVLRPRSYQPLRLCGPSDER
jgi:hypothetical protein